MAMGAGASEILRTLLGRTLGALGLGLVLGLAAALLLGRFVESLLFGVSPNDPRTFGVAAVAVAVVALVACLLPARKALRVDPREVLLEE